MILYMENGNEIRKLSDKEGYINVATGRVNKSRRSGFLYTTVFEYRICGTRDDLTKFYAYNGIDEDGNILRCDKKTHKEKENDSEDTNEEQESEKKEKSEKPDRKFKKESEDNQCTYICGTGKRCRNKRGRSLPEGITFCTMHYNFTNEDMKREKRERSEEKQRKREEYNKQREEYNKQWEEYRKSEEEKNKKFWEEFERRQQEEFERQKKYQRDRKETREKTEREERYERRTEMKQNLELEDIPIGNHLYPYILNFFGVDNTVTYRQLRTRYKKLSLQHHPDKRGNEEMFKVLNNYMSEVELQKPYIFEKLIQTLN